MQKPVHIAVETAFGSAVAVQERHLSITWNVRSATGVGRKR